MDSNEKKRENKNEKRHIGMIAGLLAGLFSGAALGVLIGAAAHDIPLYTSFGMILGMAIFFDMMMHAKHKEKNSGADDK